MSKIDVISLRPGALPHWTGLTAKCPVSNDLPRPSRRASAEAGARAALGDTVGQPGPAGPIAWRTNLTHRQFADLFGVGLVTVHRIIDRMTPLTAGLLDPPGGSHSDLCGSWTAPWFPSTTA